MNDAQLNQLYQYALVYCNQPTDAHNLLQSALQHDLSTTHHTDSLMVCIRQRIRNGWADNHRKTLSNKNVDSAPHDISETTLENISLQHSILKNIWWSLTYEERELLYYWAVLGFTISEISHELNKPKGSLLSRLHCMRKRIEKLAVGTQDS